MSRKVYVNVKVRLIIDMEEGVSVDNIINDMEYNFSFPGEEADIVDTTIEDFEVMDSK